MINLKSVGGRVLHLSASVPIQPASAPKANVRAMGNASFWLDYPMPPVTVRRPRTTGAVKLSAAMVRIRAKCIVQQQRELREQFIRF